ncbi:hypothetical protein GOP47_0005156 [Adiantum capillus-veneris]|uniref:GTD-binding domain-containing protein n=1 Tax=Adiantum capillus-veneris TaxID=13818 RepID=A0A9D4V682_ADICA|nr:hypothetical protein GOP47_0005156 [Adiantum capillus-veneris]
MAMASVLEKEFSSCNGGRIVGLGLCFSGIMKSTSDRRSYLSKRTEDRTDPLSHGDGKGKPSSWQRSVKRKLPSSACELPPQARKVDSTLCTSQNLRPHRHLASIRKSLSDPLQVFGDCDESSSSQHRGSSRTNPSECKDRLPRDNEGRPDTLEDAENLSKEKRRWLKPGLKDSTNLDPKATLKQNNLHTYNEVMVLKETLHAEREAHRSLQTELDEERNAASSAANEAMSMIARLQEEKAAVLMEARQFKRMAEERELHNQEAISLLKEMLMNKEEEALALENELVACRQMFLAIEAGEPLQNMTPKYLDMENYSNSNQQTELVSCDSKQLSLYVNDRPRGSFKEEPIISEFSGRTFGRSLKGFASDSIRGNLEDFFNRAGESTEEMMNCNEMQYNKEWPGTMYDKVVDYSTSVDNSMSFIHGAIHGIGNGDTLEQIPSPSSGKSFSECQAEPPAFCTDEQSRSLWDRIMKLEHRLETFGVDGKGFEFDLPETIAPTPQTPGFTSCKQQVNASSLDPTSCSTLDPQKVDIVKRESVEMPGKLDCTGGSHGPEAEIEQLKGSEISSCRNQMQASLESQGRNTSHILAHPYDNFSDTVEGVHDVYEVGYQLNEGLHNECYRSPEVDSSHRAQLGSIEKPDSPSELMAPIMETMDVTPPDSAEVKNLSSSLSGAEIQQLNKRLQVLENEKHSMHQAILSLQAENKELRALEAVALELQDLKQSQNLKRTLQISELPNKRVKSEQPSFTSIFKGFFSYLPSGTNLENRSMALDLVSHSAQKDYVGLSRLLETSPHLKTETLIMRGLKVKVPAAI